MNELLGEWLGLIFNGAAIKNVNYDLELHRDVLAVLQNAQIIERVNLVQFVLHARFKESFNESTGFISVPKRIVAVYTILEKEILASQSKFMIAPKSTLAKTVSNNEIDNTIKDTQTVLDILKNFLPKNSI
jgi:hypothetical protein